MKMKKISHRLPCPLRESSPPCFEPKGYYNYAIKPDYDRRRMLAVSDFNRLDQYASSPGKRAYTVTQNSLSSIAEAETIASIHCVYPRRLNWPGWLNAVRGDMPDRRGSPIPVLTGFNVEQPR